MNPDRIKMNFPPHILKKFSLQDATLAAAYAAHALGLSSIWIGMIDEEKIMATSKHEVCALINSLSRISTEDPST